MWGVTGCGQSDAQLRLLLLLPLDLACTQLDPVLKGAAGLWARGQWQGLVTGVPPSPVTGTGVAQCQPSGRLVLWLWSLLIYIYIPTQTK